MRAIYFDKKLVIMVVLVGEKVDFHTLMLTSFLCVSCARSIESTSSPASNYRETVVVRVFLRSLCVYCRDKFC